MAINNLPWGHLGTLEDVTLDNSTTYIPKWKWNEKSNSKSI
jgi:hypothetical protein